MYYGNNRMYKQMLHRPTSQINEPIDNAEIEIVSVYDVMKEQTQNMQKEEVMHILIEQMGYNCDAIECLF